MEHINGNYSRKNSAAVTKTVRKPHEKEKYWSTGMRLMQKLLEKKERKRSNGQKNHWITKLTPWIIRSKNTLRLKSQIPKPVRFCMRLLICFPLTRRKLMKMQNLMVTSASLHQNWTMTKRRWERFIIRYGWLKTLSVLKKPTWKCVLYMWVLTTIYVHISWSATWQHWLPDWFNSL